MIEIPEKCRGCEYIDAAFGLWGCAHEAIADELTMRSIYLDQAPPSWCPLREQEKAAKDDVRTVCRFIVDHFPHYEDAVNWPLKMDLNDYKWGRAARRLLEVSNDKN